VLFRNSACPESRAAEVVEADVYSYPVSSEAAGMLPRRTQTIRGLRLSSLAQDELQALNIRPLGSIRKRSWIWPPTGPVRMAGPRRFSHHECSEAVRAGYLPDPIKAGARAL